jgi:hypothetical protein
MNAVITTVTINGFTADYQVFFICKKFKAILIQKHLAKYIPYQLDFWKEEEVWKSYHPLPQQIIDQFGNMLDVYLREKNAGNSNNPSAATG